MWVRAQIAGHQAWGIFDTGSDGTALDSEFARSIGLASRGVQSGTTVAGNVAVERLEEVEFDLEGKKLLSKETNMVPLSSELAGLQFVLGFDALEKVPFVIRPRDQKILFGPFEESPNESEFEIQGDIRPTTRLEILGESSYAMLDTGSSGGISLPRQWVEANASRLGIEASGWEKRKILSNDFLSMRFAIREIMLGHLRLKNVPAEAVESEKGSFANQSTFWGNIGWLVLQELESIAIDGQRRRITLTKTF